MHKSQVFTKIDADFPKPSFFLGGNAEKESPTFREHDLNQGYRKELSFGRVDKDCDNAGSSDEEAFIEVKVPTSKLEAQQEIQEGEFTITRMM